LESGLNASSGGLTFAEFPIRHATALMKLNGSSHAQISVMHSF